MTQFLRLHVEGTHQSWAGDGTGFRKDTELFPTRSGMVGLVAAALGLLREDPRVDLLHRTCRVSSRVLRRGTARHEYQNVRDWDIVDVVPPKKNLGLQNFVSATAPGTNRQVWRTYHTDAAFQVVLGVQDGCPFAAEAILAALQQPVFPLYLGRKYCRPSYPLVGPADEVVEADSPVDVFGPVSPHVLAFRGEDSGEDRYADGATMLAFLDLPAGVSLPTTGDTLPIQIGDALVSNRARAFTTRVGIAWHERVP